MSLATRARAAIGIFPIAIAVGYAALLETAVNAMGHLLDAFEPREAHRFTAAAMLTGTLRLRNGLGAMGHDEQVHGGAGYTNWGFGVPLLEAPFHAFHRFVPDRGIYFFYLAVTVAVLWAGLHRLVGLRGVGGPASLRRLAVSWAATLLVLAGTVYPLMSYRFLIYEETCSYLLLCELVALGAYVFALRSWGRGAIVALAVAAGMGLLVRATGLVCLAAWGLLVALESRSVRAVATLAVAAAPFVAFWLYSNWVRTGSPLALGAANALPYFAYHFPILRFGSRCADTPAHFVQTAGRLFEGLFLRTSEPQGWMQTCHFDFETRGVDRELYPDEGFLGLHVLAGLGVVLGVSLARRRGRLAALVPFAAMGLLFVAYVRAWPGFAWRYAADFWPFVLMACVHAFRALPAAANRRIGIPIALVLAAAGAGTFARHVRPARETIEVLDARGVASLERDFERSRWGTDWPLPSRLECATLPDGPYQNGAGWSTSGAVDTFTNVYLGVPESADGRYVLRMETAGMTAEVLRVHVEGRIYETYREGDTYTAAVPIDRDALHSPVVMLTVEWTRDSRPPPGQLMSIELVDAAR